MVWWPGRSLGARVLRFGDAGTDVKQLHEFLRLQGYDLGEEKIYGYLTKDAVQQFQRDHGLVADGICGKRFFDLVLRENLPIRRRVHIVQPQETLEQIAETYGVGVEAFGRYSRGREVYAGQHLIFFDREVWGRCGETLKPQGQAGALTGYVCSDSAQMQRQQPCVIQPQINSSTDELQIHNCLKTSKQRRKTAARFLDFIPDGTPLGSGLFLPWTQVPRLDGVRYLKLLKNIKKDLPQGMMLWVELGPSVRPWSLGGGVDYAKINDLVDRIVLDLPIPEEPGALFQKSSVQDLLRTVLRHIHSWKILLNVPVYAVEWKLGAKGIERAKFAYQTALTRAFRHGARLREDDDGELYYHYQSKGEQFQIRLPHYSSMAEVCALANRHNLAGVILDELGQEDPRVWQIIPQHFRSAALNFSQE